jgi:hypothetical protein
MQLPMKVPDIHVWFVVLRNWSIVLVVALPIHAAKNLSSVFHRVDYGVNLVDYGVNLVFAMLIRSVAKVMCIRINSACVMHNVSVVVIHGRRYSKHSNQLRKSNFFLGRTEVIC